MSTERYVRSDGTPCDWKSSAIVATDSHALCRLILGSGPRQQSKRWPRQPRSRSATVFEPESPLNPNSTYVAPAPSGAPISRRRRAIRVSCSPCEHFSPRSFFHAATTGRYDQRSSGARTQRSRPAPSCAASHAHSRCASAVPLCVSVRELSPSWPRPCTSTDVHMASRRRHPPRATMATASTDGAIRMAPSVDAIATRARSQSSGLSRGAAAAPAACPSAGRISSASPPARGAAAIARAPAGSRLEILPADGHAAVDGGAVVQQGLAAARDAGLELVPQPQHLRAAHLAQQRLVGLSAGERIDAQDRVRRLEHRPRGE